MKKLYCDKKNAKISGVCAGIAKYFDIDPTIIRIIWVAVTLFGGSGIVAYIICALVMPDEPELADEVDYTEVNDNE
ncbi:MAG: PspC domain-containing protein [Eubacterium sp.]|nr:PspC domain-containing protein [Eubacterium sp.]MBR1530872.1 PspC domain-containing protein [Eubacterium sp.]MBR2279292.1 PspC domain-containing protein [Eubacterium sp.]